MPGGPSERPEDVGYISADTVFRPLVPTRSAEKRIGANSNLVIAAMPAAVPTAMARVGEVPKAISATDASATPRRMAGKTGPPRKPQPRLTA